MIQCLSLSKGREKDYNEKECNAGFKYYKHGKDLVQFEGEMEAFSDLLGFQRIHHDVVIAL